jgi:hypothetical protein
MGRISAWRVLVGGAFAGVLLWFGHGFVHMVLLRDFGQALMKDGIMIDEARMKSSHALATMFLTDLATGFLIAWLYAAVRPRLGAGLMTAIVTGLFVWAVLFLQAHVPEYVWIPRFREATVLGALAGVIQFIVSAAVAGWVYAEPGDGGGAARPVGRRR